MQLTVIAHQSILNSLSLIESYAINILKKELYRENYCAVFEVCLTGVLSTEKERQHRLGGVKLHIHVDNVSNFRVKNSAS